MTPRCLWTGERTDRAIEVSLPGTDRLGRPVPPQTATVLPEHEADLRAFAARAQRHGRAFLVTILTLTVAMLLVAALSTAGVLSEAASAWGLGLGCIAMGALMIVLPFATPETVAAFGARRSIGVARVSGGIVIAVGLAIGLWG